MFLCMSCPVDCVTVMSHTLLWHTICILMVDWVHFGYRCPLQLLPLQHTRVWHTHMPDMHTWITFPHPEQLMTLDILSLTIVEPLPVPTRHLFGSIPDIHIHNSTHLCETNTSISRFSSLTIGTHQHDCLFLWVLCLSSWGYAPTITSCVLWSIFVTLKIPLPEEPCDDGNHFVVGSAKVFAHFLCEVTHFWVIR